MNEAPFRTPPLTVKPPSKPGDLIPGRLLSHRISEGELPKCPLCGEVVRDDGFFWQGSEVAELIYADVVFHPGCLHPEVVVVKQPLDGKVTPGVEVGRLEGFARGLDGWWLVLKDVVSGYGSCSINWDRVLYVERRYDPTSVPPKRR